MQNKKAYWLGYFFPMLALLGLVIVFGSKPAYERAMALNAPVTEESAPAVAPAPATDDSVAAPGITEPTLAKAPEPKPEEKVQAEPAPALLLPGAGASVDVGGAPSCVELSDLKQAVNPTPHGSPYQGQLRWSFSRQSAPHPCTTARTFSNTGQTHPAGKLKPGEYKLPYGTLTVLPRR